MHTKTNKLLPSSLAFKGRGKDNTVTSILKTAGRFVNQCNRRPIQNDKLSHMLGDTKMYSMSVTICLAAGHVCFSLLRACFVTVIACAFRLIAGWHSIVMLTSSIPCLSLWFHNVPKRLFSTPPLDSLFPSSFTFLPCNICSADFLVRVSCWTGDPSIFISVTHVFPLSSIWVAIFRYIL